MFYLEYNQDTGFPSADTAVVAELLCSEAFLKNLAPHTLFKCLMIEDLDNELAKGPLTKPVIPVGSVDFCEKALGVTIRPLNIPVCLRTDSYTGRRIADKIAHSDLPALFKRWNTDRLFIKSAERAKTGMTALYDNKTIRFLPSDGLYFVSEPIELAAEWRCFVYRGEIVDIRRYAGSYAVPFAQCDVEFAKGIVKTLGAGLRPALAAYTVDLGKPAPNDVPVVVEVHNFVACGLYGLEDRIILEMLEAGAASVRAAAQGRGAGHDRDAPYLTEIKDR